MTNDPNKPMVFKIGTVRQQLYKKSEPDLQPILEKELGTKYIDNHLVFTKFKLYCKQPTWKHPEFTYKIQLANGSQNTSVFCSMSPTELNELIKSMVQWLYENKDQHQEAIELSQELMRRHQIHNQQADTLKDLTINPDSMEQEAINNRSKLIETKFKERNIMAFIKYFTEYFTVKHRDQKKIYLDLMTSLLPDHTDEILELIYIYTKNPQAIEEEIPKIKEQLEYYFSNKDIQPEHILTNNN